MKARQIGAERNAALTEASNARLTVDSMRAERDELRAEVERRDALIRTDGYEDMRRHAADLAQRAESAERERDEAQRQARESSRLMTAQSVEREEVQGQLDEALATLAAVLARNVRLRAVLEDLADVVGAMPELDIPLVDPDSVDAWFARLERANKAARALLDVESKT